MKVKKAEITAFLSLIVVLLISFIFGIIEITVIQTEKNLSRICADGAIFSVFGEYESQLMEAYHILAETTIHKVSCTAKLSVNEECRT